MLEQCQTYGECGEGLGLYESGSGQICATQGVDLGNRVTLGHFYFGKFTVGQNVLFKIYHFSSRKHLIIYIFSESKSLEVHIAAFGLFARPLVQVVRSLSWAVQFGLDFSKNDPMSPDFPKSSPLYGTNLSRPALVKTKPFAAFSVFLTLFQHTKLSFKAFGKFKKLL